VVAEKPVAIGQPIVLAANTQGKQKDMFTPKFRVPLPETAIPGKPVARDEQPHIDRRTVEGKMIIFSRGKQSVMPGGVPMSRYQKPLQN
jgi:hypothetical protein